MNETKTPDLALPTRTPSRHGTTALTAPGTPKVETANDHQENMQDRPPVQKFAVDHSENEPEQTR